MQIRRFAVAATLSLVTGGAVVLGAAAPAQADTAWERTLAGTSDTAWE